MPAYPAAYRPGAQARPQPSGLSKPRPRPVRPKPLGRLPRIPKFPANANTVHVPGLGGIRRHGVRVGAGGYTAALLNHGADVVAWATNAAHWEITRCPYGGSPTHSREGLNACDPDFWFDADIDPYQAGSPSHTNADSYTWADYIGQIWVNPSGWANRYTIVERWVRKAGAVVPTPLRNVWDYPEIVPFPSANPDALPILKPASPGLPLPWRRALPRPGEQPATQPQPNPWPQPNPRPRPYPLPALPFPIVVWPPAVPWPPGNPRPVVGPETIVEVVPGGAPAVVTRPNTSPTPTRPPRPPEREAGKKKPSVPGAPGYPVINAVFGGAELLDNLNASLPPERRLGPDASPFELAQNIYDNADALDPAAVVNMIINERIEDGIYGLLGSGAGAVNRATGQATGAGNAIDPTGGGAPIPQVEFNDDGTATLTIGGEPIATLQPNG